MYISFYPKRQVLQEMYYLIRAESGRSTRTFILQHDRQVDKFPFEDALLITICYILFTFLVLIMLLYVCLYGTHCLRCRKFRSVIL